MFYFFIELLTMISFPYLSSIFRLRVR